jgi:hypothetical protein
MAKILDSYFDWFNRTFSVKLIMLIGLMAFLALEFMDYQVTKAFHAEIELDDPITVENPNEKIVHKIKQGDKHTIYFQRRVCSNGLIVAYIKRNVINLSNGMLAEPPYDVQYAPAKGCNTSTYSVTFDTSQTDALGNDLYPVGNYVYRPDAVYELFAEHPIKGRVFVKTVEKTLPVEYFEVIE